MLREIRDLVQFAELSHDLDCPSLGSLTRMLRSRYQRP